MPSRMLTGKVWYSHGCPMRSLTSSSSWWSRMTTVSALPTTTKKRHDESALFDFGDDMAQLAVQLEVDGRECRAFDQLLTLRVPAQPGTTPLPECIRPQGSAPGSEVLTSALAALKRSGNQDDAAMQLVEQDDDGYSSIVGGE